MKIYTSRDFQGHYPTGTAAVIIANSEEEARELLIAEAKECGLDLTNDNFTIQRVTQTKPMAIILQNGDY